MTVCMYCLSSDRQQMGIAYLARCGASSKRLMSATAICTWDALHSRSPLSCPSTRASTSGSSIGRKQLATASVMLGCSSASCSATARICHCVEEACIYADVKATALVTAFHVYERLSISLTALYILSRARSFCIQTRDWGLTCMEHHQSDHCSIARTRPFFCATLQILSPSTMQEKQAVFTIPVRNGPSWASKVGCRLISDATAARISNASAGI